ncbi:MAG: phosphotransferase [Holosporaceae bacterium]
MGFFVMAHAFKFFFLGALVLFGGCMCRMQTLRQQDTKAIVAIFNKARGIKPLLGGISTTRLYRFQNAQKEQVARFLPTSTAIIDCEKEITAHQKAAVLGLAPPIRYVSPDKHFVVMDFVRGYNMWGSALTLETLKMLGETLAGLHQEAKAQKTASSASDLLRSTLSHPGWQHLRQTFCALETKLLSQGPAAFCHVDVHPGNVIVSPDGLLWFVDWTNARTYSPYYDLAYFAVVALLAPAQEATLLKAYRTKAAFAFDAQCYVCAKKMALIKYIDALLTFEQITESDFDVLLKTPLSAQEKRALSDLLKRQVIERPSFQEALKAMTAPKILKACVRWAFSQYAALPSLFPESV